MQGHQHKAGAAALSYCRHSSVHVSFEGNKIGRELSELLGLPIASAALSLSLETPKTFDNSGKELCSHNILRLVGCWHFISFRKE